MPSESKTPNIGLNQWQGNEYVKRQDFVDDNNKIDNEIGKIKKQIEGISPDASSITYDNTTSELESDNVQDAIDDVNAKANANETSISSLKSKLDNVYGENENLNNTHIIKSYPGKYFSAVVDEKDLNNIKYNLICYTTSNDNLINLPNGQTGASGILEVTQTFTNSSSQHTIQRYTNTVTNTMYVRSFNKDKNAWTDWSLVNTLNASNPNILLNGSFQVWQRGTQFLSGSGYTADRWKRHDYTPGIHILKNTKGMNLKSTGASQSVLISQCIEGESIGSLWGKDVTASLDYKTFEGNPEISIEIRYDTPLNHTGGSVNRRTTKATSVNGVKEATISCTMKNLEYDYKTLIVCVIVSNKVDTSNFSTMLRGVKLEIGDKATPIGEHNYADELLKCKRYYDKCMISQSACVADGGQLYVDLHTTVYEKRITQPTVKFIGNCYAKPQSSGAQIALSDADIFKYFGGLEIKNTSILAGKIYTVNNNNESGNNVSVPAWVEIDAEIY